MSSNILERAIRKADSLDPISRALEIEELLAMYNDDDYKINVNLTEGLILKRTIDDVFKKANSLIDMRFERLSSLAGIRDDLDAVVRTPTLSDDLKVDDEIKMIDTISSSNIKIDGDRYTLNSPLHNKTNPLPSNISFKTNGYIGDTRRGYIDGIEYRFQGHDNPMANIEDLLTGSMCNFEMFRCKGRDLSSYLLYKEGVSCISTDDSLFVEITYEFDSPSRTNVISFVDSISESFIVDNIIIKDESDNIYTYDISRKSNWNNEFFIKPVDIATITLNLIQKNFRTESIICADSGYYIGSISSLGMHINKGEIIHSSLGGAKATVDKLFEDVYPRFLEIANRYNICIGEFNTKNIEYEKEGTVIRKISTYNPIEAVTLLADENITDGQSINYFISSDDKNYVEVVPIKRAGLLDVHTVIFTKASSLVSSGSVYISPGKKVTDIYIKIILKTNSKDASPVVELVSLNIKEDLS